MDVEAHKGARKRKKRGFMRMVIRTIFAFLLFVRMKIKDDAIVIFKHNRLFLGLVLLIIGILSFESGKYCDGNSSNFYSCTRPSTYYYYPWWTIVFIVIGSFFIVLWFLRRKVNP